MQALKYTTHGFHGDEEIREREGESMIWKSFCTPKTKMTIQKKNPSKKEDVYAVNNGYFPASHVRFGGAYIKGTQKNVRKQSSQKVGESRDGLIWRD